MEQALPILLIVVKPLIKSVVSQLAAHYSVLHFDKKLHLDKPIDQIGQSDVLIVDIKHGLFDNIRNNKILRWLRRQDLSKFKPIYVYGKTKFKAAFNTAVKLKRMPVIRGRNLIKASSLVDDSKEQSVSFSVDDMSRISEELDIPAELRRFHNLMDEFSNLRDDYRLLESKNLELLESIKKLQAENGHLLALQDDPTRRPNNVTQFKSQEKHVQPIPNGVRLMLGEDISETLKWRNRVEKRRIQRRAREWTA